MKLKLLALLIMILACVTVIASEAPWYKWKNKSDRTILCAQNTPGESWDLYQGPFMESHCKKSGNPQ